MAKNQLKVFAAAWATTSGVAYVLCALFDALFPPYGLLGLLAPASPWPLFGGISGYLMGFVTFAFAGFVVGTVYSVAWGFWAKRMS